MFCEIKPFDPEIDQNEVIPGRSINLRDAFETGVVKSTGTDLEFNNLDDPNTIGNRIEDEFDAVNHQRALQETVYKKSKTNKVSTPTGESV